jgi:hypothetical protein
MVDQPEQRPSELEAEYRRLVISYFDLSEATQFLNQLKALGPINFEEPIDVLELRRALTIASIVAYGRPFTRNDGAPHTAPRIKIENIDTVSPTQRDLHATIIKRRNSVIAHSDAEMAALRYERDHPNGPVPHIVDPRIALTLGQAESFHALSFKVSLWVSSRAYQISGVPVMGARRGAPSEEWG